MGPSVFFHYLSLLVGEGVVAVAVYMAVSRSLRPRLRRSFSTAAALLGLWNFSYAIMAATRDATVASVAYKVGSAGWTIALVILLLVLRELRAESTGDRAGYPYIVSWCFLGLFFWIAALAGKGIATGFVPSTWGWRELMPSGSPWVLAFGAFFVALIVELVRETALIRRQSRLNKDRIRFTYIILPFLGAALIGVVFNVLFPLVSGASAPPLGAVSAGLAMIVVSVGVVRTRVLVLEPQYVAENLLFEVSDVVFLLDPGGRIIRASRSSSELLGVKPEALAGETVGVFCRADTGEDVFSRHLALEGASEEVFLEVPGGEALPMSCTLQAVRDVYGDMLGYLAVLKDLRKVKQLENLAAELEARRMEQESLASTDPLTGLANRRKAESFLARELARFDRTGTPFSLIMLDLDHFKAVNDRFGHPTGDRVLMSVASAIAGSIRAEDIASRWGGEEFLVLLVDSDAGDAPNTAERIRRAIASACSFLPDGLSASAGVVASSSGEGVGQLLVRADRALYEAKRSGRDRVVAG